MNPKSTACRQILSTLLLTAAFGFSAGAQTLVNGDFESPGSFTGWTTNAGVVSAVQPIAGVNSARIRYSISNSGNALTQILGDTFSQFTLSFDAAASDPGSSSARSLQLVLRTGSTFGDNTRSINMRLVGGTTAGFGTVQVYNGSAWVTALTDVFSLSTAESGAGFLVNTIQFDGDFTSTPFYTITVNGTTSASLSAFQSGTPTAGQGLAQISFGSGNMVTGSWSVVDNFNVMAVPEPGVATLLVGLGLTGLIVLRRRS